MAFIPDIFGACKDLFGSLEKSEENPEGVEFNPETQCVMPITSDKGLCGGVNTQIVKLTRLSVIPAMEAAGKSVKLVCVGEPTFEYLVAQFFLSLDFLFFL